MTEQGVNLDEAADGGCGCCWTGRKEKTED